MAYTAINDANLFFGAKKYTGSGASNAITGVGFQPDFTWVKRTDGAYTHWLFDSPRGVTKYISSQNSGAETTDVNSLTSFDSDGFTLGSATIPNSSGDPYISWNWKGGTTSGITTDGNTTITPNAYSFSADAGISIVKFTGDNTSGAKVAHGLGVKPDWIMVKALSGTAHWGNYTAVLGATKYLVLSDNGQYYSSAGYWNDTEPDDVNFTLGNNTDTNPSGTDAVAYCFASKPGFSQMGGYEGNNNADGPFIYTGFRPAFLMIKKNSGTKNWFTWDNRRNTFNVVTCYLRADRDLGGDCGVNFVDFCSNGFKWVTTDGAANEAGDWDYAAFAEAPLVNSEGVPGNAR